MDSPTIKDVLISLFDISKTFKEPKRFVSFLLLVLLIGFIVFSQTQAFNNILASAQLDNNQVFWLIVIGLSFSFIVAMVILVSDIAKKPHKSAEHEITVTVHVYRPPYRTNHIVDALVKLTKPGVGVVDQRTDNTGIATFQIPSTDKGKNATFCAWKNNQNSSEVTELLKDHLHVEIAWDYQEKEQEEQSSQPLKSSPDNDEARQSYLNAIIADCRTLRLDVLDEQAGDPNAARLSLEDVYIALNTTTSRIGRDERGREKPYKPEEKFEIDDKAPLSVLEALLAAPDRKMVLLGLPGTGKSTFVRYLSLRMAQELISKKRKLEQWEGKAILPVMISLGRFAETLPLSLKQGNAKLLEEFIQNSLAQDERTKSFSDLILDVIQSEGGLFFFDGLDEVADLTIRPIVVQSIDAFVQKYGRNSNSHFLVTCRTFSYQDPNWQLPRWVAYEIALLTDEQINDFVTAWYEQHALLDQTRTKKYYDDRRDQLLAALEPEEPRHLLGIARYPIILTIMAIVHASYDLPDSRAQVYMKCVDILLVKWQAKRMIQGREQTRDILKELDIPGSRLQKALFEIAYRAHLGRQDSASESEGLVTGGLVTSVMEEHLGDNEKLKIFLDYCQSSNGLLMLSGVVKPDKSDDDLPPRRVYTFPHLTFEEYLASRHLEMSDPREIHELLDAAHDRWRTVTTMLVEYLCYERNDRLRVNCILEELITRTEKKVEDKDWRAFWLAGELLVIYRRAIGKPVSPHEERIITGIRDLVVLGNLQPVERAAAGDTLARLGDPRFDPDFYYLPHEELRGFVLIPAGPFWMGSDKTKDPEAYDDELRQHTVTLPDYFMMRYPVTTVQYRHFVEQSGYKTSDPASLQGPANHPVVWVTWYDALAYADWLTDQMKQNPHTPRELRERLQAGWRISLPSEAEWEKAARGTDGRIYPWEGEFDPNRANCSETGLGRTSAVGCFPGGCSPYGILDLSGNTWEWTRSLWGKDPGKPDFVYPYDPGDKKRENLKAGKNVWRILRGGSFSRDRRNVRCACRVGFYPDFRFSDIGVRLVLSPFTS